MNLLFITIDGGRLDRILKSEKFNEIAKNGTMCNNVVTYAPYTIGAMHAVFSGEFGFKTGVNSYWSTYQFKKDQYKTLTEYLKEDGFKTYGDAINELILPKQGFNRLNYHNEDKDDLLQRHKDLLEEMKELNSKGEKFFLYVHYSNIHTNIKKNVLKKFNNFSNEYFKNKNNNEKNYDIYFEEAENYISSIINYCKKLDILQNTIVVIISDHGISIGDKFGERAYGAYCYDYTIRTYLLFLNEKFLPSTIINQQIRSIDIMPTILEILKIKQDPKFKKISGRSVLPLINGIEEERIAITETGNPLQNEEPPREPNVVAIRKSNWKLIWNLHDNSKELYDLQKDPKETVNLNEKNKEMVDKLLHKLLVLHPRLAYVRKKIN